MTGVIYQFPMPGMAKPGRRVSTPKQFRQEFMRRTKEAREKAQLSHEQMAALLTEAVHRPIAADTYRKWEKKALLPHDLIMPFCEITHADPFELLTGIPFSLTSRIHNPRRNRAA